MPTKRKKPRLPQPPLIVLSLSVPFLLSDGNDSSISPSSSQCSKQKKRYCGSPSPYLPMCACQPLFPFPKFYCTALIFTVSSFLCFSAWLCPIIVSISYSEKNNLPSLSLSRQLWCIVRYSLHNSLFSLTKKKNIRKGLAKSPYVLRDVNLTWDWGSVMLCPRFLYIYRGMYTCVTVINSSIICAWCEFGRLSKWLFLCCWLLYNELCCKER